MGIAHRAGPGPVREPQRSVHLDPKNLHLEASGHNALETGLDLSGTFTDDIDGAARPTGAAWDIGPDEGALKPKIVRWREVSPQ